MRICLYEDRRAADLNPLTLTRLASDLLCGLTTLGEKQIRHFGAEVVGYLCRPALAEWLRVREPDKLVNDPAWFRAAPTVLVNARWLPPRLPRVFARDLFADGPFIGTANGEIAFAMLDTTRLQVVAPNTVDNCLRDWAQTLPRREVGGTVINRVWELIDHNSSELANDFDATYDSTEDGYHPPGVSLVGPADRLFVHHSARVDPLVVADTTRGPVVIGEGAVVTAFTRLEGPCGIGAYTQLLSANIRAGTTVGPHCRIGGEVESSIVLGYTNKYHDGFLGHSYVGEWVNLAAGTITGDLRCDYRPIRMSVNGVEVSTGQTKLGSLIGDHAKTGLGVLLNCGTTLNPFAQVLPTGEYAPRVVPSFHRVGTDGLKPLDVNQLMTTADVVMQRRGRELTPQLEAVYRVLANADAATTTHTATTLPLRRSA
jgi:UDP-N-acetylglucosamine diphosphorylase/glucosamine-1-phosphate N-acetyltransferase